MFLRRVMLLSDSNNRSHVIYCTKRIFDNITGEDTCLL